MSDNLRVDKIDSSILNLQSLEAEFDLVMIQYKQAYIDYINLLETKNQNGNNINGNVNDNSNNNNEFISLQGRRFWGTSGIKDLIVNKEEECKAACAGESKCTGATFNSSSGYCWLRTGNNNISVSNNNNEYAIIPIISQNVNNLKMLNDRLIDLSNKIMDELNKTEPIVLTENEKKDEKINEMENMNQILLDEKQKIYSLLDQYDDLNAQYDINSIYVRQSNATYIVWSVIAIIMISIIIRFAIMPDSKMADHIKFSFLIILFFIFIVCLTKMNNPSAFAIFGLFFIIIIIIVMGKINKGSGSGSGSGSTPNFGVGSNNNSYYNKPF